MRSSLLTALTTPRRIALIGASDRDPMAAALTRHALEGGFNGIIDLVNRRHDTVAGRPALASVADLPATPDIAVVMTPDHAQASILRQLKRRDTPLVLIQSRAAQPVQHRREARLGPVEAGLALPAIGLHLAPVRWPVKLGGLALITRSHTAASMILGAVQAVPVGFAQVIATGAGGSALLPDIIDAVAASAAEALLVEVDAEPDLDRILAAVHAAAGCLPVILWPSTAGALPERLAAFRAAGERCGALVAGSFREAVSALCAAASGLLGRHGTLRMVCTHRSAAHVLANALALPADASTGIAAPGGLERIGPGVLALTTDEMAEPLAQLLEQHPTDAVALVRSVPFAAPAFASPRLIDVALDMPASVEAGWTLHALLGAMHFVRASRCRPMPMPTRGSGSDGPDSDAVAAILAAPANRVRVGQSALAALLRAANAPLQLRRQASRDSLRGALELRADDVPGFGTVIRAARFGGGLIDVAILPLEIESAARFWYRIDHALPAFAPLAEAGVATLLALNTILQADPRLTELRLTLVTDQGGLVLVAPKARRLIRRRVRPLLFAPYPLRWIRELHDKDGQPLILRPIRPDDSAALRMGFKALSPEDIRFRFLHPLGDLSESQAARLSHVDYRREIAFLLHDAQLTMPHDRFAVARLAQDADGEGADFALVIGPGLRRQGFGRLLMEVLHAFARERGLRSLHGDVLAENTAMRGLAASMGYEETEVGDGIIRVERRV